MFWVWITSTEKVAGRWIKLQIIVWLRRWKQQGAPNFELGLGIIFATANASNPSEVPPSFTRPW